MSDENGNSPMIGKEELETRHVTPSAFSSIKITALLYGLVGSLFGAGVMWGATASQVGRNTEAIASLTAKRELDREILIRLDERTKGMAEALGVADSKE